MDIHVGLWKEIRYLYRRYEKITESACRVLEDARVKVQDLFDYALDLHHLLSSLDMLQIAPTIPQVDEPTEAMREGDVGSLFYVLNIDLTNVFSPDLAEYLTGPVEQGRETDLLERSYTHSTSNALTRLMKIGKTVLRDSNLTGILGGNLAGFPELSRTALGERGTAGLPQPILADFEEESLAGLHKPVWAALEQGGTVGLLQSILADLKEESLAGFTEFSWAALVEGAEFKSEESNPTALEEESKVPWNLNILRSVLNLEEDIYKTGRKDREVLMDEQNSTHLLRRLTASQEEFRTWISEGRQIQMELEESSAAYSKAIYSTLEMNQTSYLQDASGDYQRDVYGDVSTSSYFPDGGSQKATNLERIRDVYAKEGVEEKSIGRGGAINRKVIEVPTLAPQEKFSHIEGSSAKRVSRIWDALQHQEEETSWPGQDASLAMLKRPAISLPILYRILTDSFSSLPPYIFPSDQITRSEELKSINQFMSSALETDEVNEKALEAISEMAINISSEKSVNPHLSSHYIIYPLALETDNEEEGAGGRLSLAQSMAIARSLPRIMAYEQTFQGRLPGEAIQMQTLNILPTVSNSFLQILSQGKSGEASRASGGSTFHLNNHFNITINAKAGEETELRELGRKIGIILSDEIRRYGGMG